ncbi:MAG: hypothetical protein GXP59_01970 [Deltaproteobacteria bacterium]|nr:hypothetical protein [Deltaproteobacteria bacterium]
MTCREALNILMRSPFYFKFNLPERKILLKEFLGINDNHAVITHKSIFQPS